MPTTPNNLAQIIAEGSESTSADQHCAVQPGPPSQPTLVLPFERSDASAAATKKHIAASRNGAVGEMTR